MLESFLPLLNKFFMVMKQKTTLDQRKFLKQKKSQGLSWEIKFQKLKKPDCMFLSCHVRVSE